METLATELDARLLRLYWLVGRDAGRELSRTASSVLATLRDGGPKRITELAASEAIAQPSVTTLVGRLERQGLVTRGPDPSDARAVLVALTDDGREALRRLGSRRAAILAERLAALDDADRAALRAALPALDHLADTAKEPR